MSPSLFIRPFVFLTAFAASVTSGVVCAQSPAGKVNINSRVLSSTVNSARTPEQDWEEEFQLLERDMKRVAENKFDLERLRAEAARPESVYSPEDKNPCEIIYKRTMALLNHLDKKDKKEELIARISGELKEWKARNEALNSSDRNAQMTSFKELCSIRRKLAFSNSLLNFDKLLFLTHYTQRQGRGEVHIVDQYLGFNAKSGGAPYVLENPFSDNPTARTLLENTPVGNGPQRGKALKDGSFLSLELSYDAKRIYFAWTQAIATKVTGKEDWSKNFGTYAELMRREPSYHHYYWAPDRVYHIYRLDLDSGKLSQLTDGSYNTYDPCELPNGRLVYISEEQGGNQRCGGRWITAGILHSMRADGTDSYPLSFHETNEWHPSVNNDGMIVYTRWDYVDRDDCGAHHLWQCYPDGRDPRSPHGNYAKLRERRPFAEMSYRAIPNNRKLVAVTTAHHGIAYGSIITVDPSIPDDGMTSQIKRITPEVHFQEAESEPGVPFSVGQTNSNHNAEYYGTPWPLDEDFYLCVYARDHENYGIYLVDSFGNRELVWKDKNVPCLDPIPFRPRTKPPVIPDMTTQSKFKRMSGAKPADLAEVFVSNVYDTERPLPEGTKVKWLRVVNIFPKSNAFINEPNIGMANESLARGSLGVVPVEEDGSVFFRMPVNVNVYFQLLDENMQAVHSMRSSTYAHSGERLSCVGCHESRYAPPANSGVQTLKAITRAPSALVAEPSGSYPLTFPRLVQPVLDKNCVQCHAREQKAPPLDKETYRMVKNDKGKEERQNVAHGWSNGFMTLHSWGWGRHGGNGSYWGANKFTYTVPGDVGAKASRLLPFLEKGHHDVRLTREDWYRLSLWMDLNTNFYGSYDKTDDQAKGKIILPKFGLAKVNPLNSRK